MYYFALCFAFTYDYFVEFVQILQLISSSMSRLGSSALFYLAAAVSDFYVPWESMVMYHSSQRNVFIYNDGNKLKLG